MNDRQRKKLLEKKFRFYIHDVGSYKALKIFNRIRAEAYVKNKRNMLNK